MAVRTSASTCARIINRVLTKAQSHNSYACVSSQYLHEVLHHEGESERDGIGEVWQVIGMINPRHLSKGIGGVLEYQPGCPVLVHVAVVGSGEDSDDRRLLQVKLLKLVQLVTLENDSR
jgi:hypothetical protein